jgi:hypothetical protein
VTDPWSLEPGGGSSDRPTGEASKHRIGSSAFDWIGRDPHESGFHFADWWNSPLEGTRLSYKLHSDYLAGLRNEFDLRVDAESTAYKSGFKDPWLIQGDVVIYEPFIPLAPQPAIEVVSEIFRQLADSWVADTGEIASPRARFMHKAYQQIIGLGKDALPLLLTELRDRPDDWFWALASISREDPASGMSNPDEARAAWLAWGSDRGLVAGT